MLERLLGFLKPEVRFAPWQGEVRTLPPPATVTLALSMPGEMPFEPIVNVGDPVKTGQFIAMRSNKAGLHSTITGVVTSIGPGHCWNGSEVLMLTIRRTGDDDMVKVREIPDMETASREDLVQILSDLGFDSPWKPESLQHLLCDIEKVPVNKIIVRAVDQEPPLSVQRRFLTEFLGDLRESIAGVKIISGDVPVVLVVHREMAETARKELPGVEIFPVGNNHLDTNPMLTLEKITGKFYSFHDNPLADGIMVFSAEDLAFIARCLHKGKSRTNKLITVYAPEMEKPITVRVRLGTPLKHILSELGITYSTGDRIILNGLLTGMAQANEDAPVCRANDGLMVVRKKDVVPFTDEACVNCGRCGWMCPVRIQVNMVGRYAEFGLFEKAVLNGSGSCVGCGMCAFVCPSRRPLVHYMRFANTEYQKKLQAYRDEQARAARREAEMKALEEMEAMHSGSSSTDAAGDQE